MSTKLHNVFVYGTLKRGEPNHGWFSKNVTGYYKFLSDAETVEKYPLIIATRYNVPFLLYSKGTGNNVKGELYEVDDKVLADLDVLEEHPDFYVREEQQVKVLDKCKEIKTAWIYFIKDFRPELLNSTMLESYSNNNPYGLKYVGRYLRDENHNHRKEILNRFST